MALLLFLVTPLSTYVTWFAARCWRERSVNRYLALVVMLVSLVLVHPLVSTFLAHSLTRWF
jgi:hypothetical protein